MDKQKRPVRGRGTLSGAEGACEWALDKLEDKGVRPRVVSVLCLVSQSCPALWDPRDCSPPGSSVPGILQARIVEWVAMPSSRGSSQPRDGSQVSLIADGFFTS